MQYKSPEFSRRHDRVSGILARASDLLLYDDSVFCMARSAPPVQPCEVYLAGVIEGLFIRSYRYMFVYLYTTES